MKLFSFDVELENNNDIICIFSQNEQISLGPLVKQGCDKILILRYCKKGMYGAYEYSRIIMNTLL